MIFILLSSAVFAHRQLSQNCDKEFDEFKNRFGKSYDSAEEETHRRDIFCSKCSEGDHWTFESPDADSDCTKNKFADQAPGDRMMNFGLVDSEAPMLRGNQGQLQSSEFSNMDEPSEWDWLSRGVLSPVQDQGICGSCWAFAVAGACEGNLAKKYDQQTNSPNHPIIRNLSEEWLKDCTYGQGSSHGCNGGHPEHAIRNLIQNGRTLPDESNSNLIPYDDRDDYWTTEAQEMCAAAYTRGVTLQRYSASIDVLTANTEQNMRKLLVRMGPISVAMDAGSHGNYSIQDYTGGRIGGQQCAFTQFTHAVLLVAYNRDEYKLKNSWGSNWGEDGYFRMVRDYNGLGGRGCMGIGAWVDSCNAEFAATDDFSSITTVAPTTQAPTTQAPADPCANVPWWRKWWCQWWN
jgi:hypothetical protein